MAALERYGAVRTVRYALNFVGFVWIFVYSRYLNNFNRAPVLLFQNGACSGEALSVLLGYLCVCQDQFGFLVSRFASQSLRIEARRGSGFSLLRGFR